MKRLYSIYLLGLGLLAAAGFCSPVWYLGFIPLGAGALYATYNLIEVEDASGDAPRPSR